MPPKEKSQGGWIKEAWNSMSKRAVSSQGQNPDKSRHISSAKTQEATEIQRRCFVLLFVLCFSVHTSESRAEASIA